MTLNYNNWFFAGFCSMAISAFLSLLLLIPSNLFTQITVSHYKMHILDFVLIFFAEFLSVLSYDFVSLTHLFILYNIESINWFGSTKNAENRKIVARELHKTTCANVDTQPHTAWETETETKKCSLYFCKLHTRFDKASTHARTHSVHKHTETVAMNTIEMNAR